MDGVIVDNTENKIKVAKRLGFNLKPEETPADAIEKILPEAALAELRKLLYYDKATALSAQTVRGAKSGLKKLKKSGLKYFLISRRKNPEIGRQLLEKFGLWPRYFDDGNAFFIAESEDKNKKAAELGVDIYLDDQPGVLEKLVDVKERILFDRFNRFNDLPFNHKKVSSWKEFLSHLI